MEVDLLKQKALCSESVPPKQECDSQQVTGTAVWLRQSVGQSPRKMAQARAIPQGHSRDHLSARRSSLVPNSS